LQELARVPDPFIFDLSNNGPKALLAGLAHQRAGRADAAAAQFREGERLLREKLAEDSDNEALRATLAVALASAGRNDEARRELTLIEPLVRSRAPTVYRGRLVAAIMQAYGAMKDYGAMAFWLRKIFAEPSNIPLTPASFRLDPRFNAAASAPDIQALLTEFAALDAPKSADTPAAQKSVAVLAFKNLSDERDGDYFSEGISEELLNVLAKVPELTVKARPSSFSFKDKSDTAQEIGRKLTVAHLVEGTVRRLGNDVRVVAHLRRTDTGDQLWTDRFDGAWDKPWELQDRIAARIAQELKLGDTPRAAKTVNPEAHRLVLEGWHFWHLRGEDGFARAETAFKQALEIDPLFAIAHAGAANNFVIRAQYRLLDGIGGSEGDMARGRAAAQRAIELDSTLAEAHAALGYVLFNEGHVDDSEAHFLKALSLNPSYAMAMMWHAQVLGSRGQLDLAIEETRKAAELDPLAFIIVDRAAEMQRHARRYTEAFAASARAARLRFDPFLPNLGEQMLLLTALDRQEEAVAIARSVWKNPSTRVRWVADAYAAYFMLSASFFRRWSADRR